MTIRQALLSETEVKAAREKLQPLLQVFATDQLKIEYLAERVIALEATVLKLARKLAENGISAVTVLSGQQ